MVPVGSTCKVTLPNRHGEIRLLSRWDQVLDADLLEHNFARELGTRPQPNRPVETDANVRPNQRVRSEPPDESARPRTVARQHPTDRTRDADRTSRTACAPLPALAF